MLKKLVLVFMALMLVAPLAFADTVYVDVDATGAGNGTSWTDAFVTITAAIGDAGTANGDVIKIADGDYPEDVTVNKELTLLGVGVVNVTGAGGADVITVSSNNVTLENLVVAEISGADLGAGSVLVAVGAAVTDLTITKCTLTTADGDAATALATAIEAAGAVNTWSITRNTIELEDAEVAIDVTGGGAIDAFNILGNTISGPTALTEFGYALDVDPGAGVDVDELVVAGNVFNSATVRITATNDGGGDANDTNLVNVKFYANTMVGANGITIVNAVAALAGDTQLFENGALTISGNNFGNRGTDGDHYYAIKFDLADPLDIISENVTINYNSFLYVMDGDAALVSAHVDVDQALGTAIDAKYNWWGHNGGPEAAVESGSRAALDAANFDGSDFLLSSSAPIPNFTAAATFDADKDGKIDTIRLTLDYFVDPASIGTAGLTIEGYELDGAPAISMDANGDGTPDGLTYMSVFVVEKSSMDTGAVPTVSYVIPTADTSKWKGIIGTTAQAMSAFTITPDDMVPPEVVSAVTRDANSNGKIDGIVVTFSEAMKAMNSAAWLTEFTFAGAQDPNGNDYSEASAIQASNVVTFAVSEFTPLDPPAAQYDSEKVPSFTLNGNGTVVDLNNNNELADAGVQGAVAVTPTDGAAPVAVSAVTADGDDDGFIETILVTYSEDITLVDVDGDGQDDDGITALSVATAENSVTMEDVDATDTELTFAGDVVTFIGTNGMEKQNVDIHPWDTDKTPELTVAGPVAGITDGAGNAWSSFLLGELTLTPTDGASPVLVAAEGMLDANDLYITFSEPIIGTAADSTVIAADLDLAYVNQSADGVASVNEDSLFVDADGSDAIIVINMNTTYVAEDFGEDGPDVDDLIDANTWDTLQVPDAAGIKDFADNAVQAAGAPDAPVQVIMYDVTAPTINNARVYDLDADGWIDHIRVQFSEGINDAVMTGYGDGTGINAEIAPFITVAGYTVVGVNFLNTADMLDGDGDFDTDLWVAATAAAPEGVAVDANGRAIIPTTNPIDHTDGADGDTNSDAFIWIMVQEGSYVDMVAGDTAVTPVLGVAGDDATSSQIADTKINYLATVTDQATADYAGPAIMSAELISTTAMNVAFSESLTTSQIFSQSGDTGGPDFRVLYGTTGQSDWSNYVKAIDFASNDTLTFEFANSYAIDAGKAVQVAMESAGDVADAAGRGNTQVAGNFGTGNGNFITAAVYTPGSGGSSDVDAPDNLVITDRPNDNGYFFLATFDASDDHLTSVQSYQFYVQQTEVIDDTTSVDNWVYIAAIEAGMVGEDGNVRAYVPTPINGEAVYGVVASTGTVVTGVVNGVAKDGIPVAIAAEGAAKVAEGVSLSGITSAVGGAIDNIAFSPLVSVSAADAENGIQINWVAPDDHGLVGQIQNTPIYGVESYDVYRRIQNSGAEFELIGQVGGGATAYVDMVENGATIYEYQITMRDGNVDHNLQSAIRTALASTGGADFNSDNVVGIQDFSMFAAQFGKTMSSDAEGFIGAFDLNSDGKVDISDFSLFASMFGETMAGASKVASAIPTTDIGFGLSAELDEASSMYYLTVNVDQADAINGIDFHLAYDSAALEFDANSVSGLAGLNIVGEETEGLVRVSSMFTGEAFNGAITLGFKSKGIESDLDFEIVSGFVNSIEGLMASSNLGEVSLKAVPTVYALNQNFPNPFNPTTTIEYQIPQSGNVELVVYNMAGQKIRTLINGMQDAAFYKAVWDGRNDSGETVASGLYFYKLVAGNFSKIEKMTLLK